MDFMVPFARSIQIANATQAVAHTYSVSYSNTQEENLKAVVSCNAGIPPRKLSYNVDCKNKTCDCLHWQQSGVPCVHQQAALLQYPGGSLATKLSHFYPWCHASLYRDTFADVELSVPFLPDVYERADSDPDKYVLYPKILCDPLASASSQRMASSGDKPSGGGVSKRAAGKLNKGPCLVCGKIISKDTTHPPRACLSHARKVNPLFGSESTHDPYMIVDDTA